VGFWAGVNDGGGVAVGMTIVGWAILNVMLIDVVGESTGIIARTFGGLEFWPA